MARRHYWQFLVTDEGNPIENAEISIYIAGTTDPAYVYTDEFGPAGTSSDPQVRTSRKGYYEFWIADKQEPNGYFLETKFKLAWAAVGVQTGYIDYVDVFSTSVAEIDITDTNEFKNKAVSNYLGKGWEEHKNSIIYENNIMQIHGIGAVDESQSDDTLSENTKMNRLVSNILANNWESHANTFYDIGWGWAYTIAGGAIEAAPENPHGIELVDITSDSIERNVLVSNSLVKGWEDHRNDTTVSSVEHPQFSHLTGDRPYTALVGYVDSTIVGAAGENDFITAGYFDAKQFGQLILSTDWIDNGDGTYRYSITHGLSVDYPAVILWEVSSNSVVQPVKIYSGTVDTIEITVTSNTDHYVRFMS